MLEKMWGKWGFDKPAVGMSCGTTALKTVERYLLKLKTCVPYDPEIPLLGIPVTETHRNVRQKANMIIFRTALFVIA